MNLLKTVNKIIVEGAMKRAMEDLIEKAAEGTPHGTDDDKYVMNVVAKVLAMDKSEMFHGDAVECEAMVRGTLGIPKK